MTYKMLQVINTLFYFSLFILSSCLQVSGWPSAGVPQKRSPPCHLLPSVALARPAVPPWVAGGGAVRVCLPYEEGWSVRQPIPLPESRDARYDSLECVYSFFRCYCGFMASTWLFCSGLFFGTSYLFFQGTFFIDLFLSWGLIQYLSCDLLKLTLSYFIVLLHHFIVFLNLTVELHIWLFHPDIKPVTVAMF